MCHNLYAAKLWCSHQWAIRHVHAAEMHHDLLLMAEKKLCENCRYSKPRFADEGNLECHRRAPLPYNAIVFHIGELIRDIAWNIYVKEMGEPPDKYSELQRETTEAGDYAVWPQVERDDFCGEWEQR